MRALFILICLLLFTPSPISAGDHRDLCDKASHSELVMEVSFTNPGITPEKGIDKWQAADPEALKKIVKSGQITKVFNKTDLAKVGDAYSKEFPIPFVFAELSHWKSFFTHNSFRMIVFLEKRTRKEPFVPKTGEPFFWALSGWAEEYTACSKYSAHYSFCEGYDEYVNTVASCATPQ